VTNQTTEETRRDFLKSFVKWGFGSLFFLFGATVLRVLYPASIATRKLVFFPVFGEDDLPRRGVKKVEVAYERTGKTSTMRVFLVNKGGRVFALSSSCSHLGCLVDWSHQRGQFVCPCHGGKYDMNGDVISGPPPHSLARMPLKITDGTVYIGIKV
jgi:cytochrome b6-f complex iron-sulfur subunit